MLHPKKTLISRAILLVLACFMLGACASSPMKSLTETYDSAKTKLLGVIKSEPANDRQKKSKQKSVKVSSLSDNKTVQSRPRKPVKSSGRKDAYGKQIVRQVQKKLIALGYHINQADGKYTAGTEAAIQDFQLDNDLNVDGKPSVSLLRIINSRLGQ